MKKVKENLPWVLIDVAGITYALSCEHVLSLYQINKVTPIPKSPAEVRGVIDFRGQIIQLIDIRKILNVKSVNSEVKEFEELMELRRNDHVNWINNLENSVKNKTEFTLTTDPHKCAFGKWYDSYNSKNTNLMFLMTFARFDTPHKAIHEIGIQAKEFIINNNRAAAAELINSTKNTELKQMMHLFDELKDAYKESRREIILVFGNDKHSIAIAVDEIVAIEHLTEFDEELIRSTITDTEYLMGNGKRKDGSPVFLLNDEYFLETFLEKVKI